MDAPFQSILLVEDNPMDADLTMRALARRNFNIPIEIARDGEEALAYIPRWESGELRPAAVLLDLNLPKISGMDVLREFQAHPITNKIPVIILVSSDEDLYFQKASKMGVKSFIVKPVDFDKFAAAALETGLDWFPHASPPTV